MKLSRIVMAWLEDMHNHALKTNIKFMMKVYNDNDRAIAYQFIRHYLPTFKVITPLCFHDGTVTHEKLFNAIYQLMKFYPH